MSAAGRSGSTVVLFGATGRIGRSIAAELSSRGHELVGVSRSSGGSEDGGSRARGNAASADDVARLTERADAVITAIGPRRDGSDGHDALSAAARGLIAGLRRSGVRRLIVVGGAGSLKHGSRRHVDSPEFPEAHKPLALAHIAARDIYFEAADLDWTYVSPAALIEPGERSGTFRVGGDELLVDGNGTSRITIPDYAIGIVDELESPTALRRQITLAY